MAAAAILEFRAVIGLQNPAQSRRAIGAKGAGLILTEHFNRMQTFGADRAINIKHEGHRKGGNEETEDAR